MFSIAHCSNNFLFIYDRTLRKRVLHRGHSNASSSNLQYPSVSLSSFNSCLRLLSRVHITSILSYIFRSILYFGKRFLRKMRPLQWAFPVCIPCRIFLSSLTLCNTPLLKRSVQLIFYILLQNHIRNFPRYF